MDRPPLRRTCHRVEARTGTYRARPAAQTWEGIPRPAKALTSPPGLPAFPVAGRPGGRSSTAPATDESPRQKRTPQPRPDAGPTLPASAGVRAGQLQGPRGLQSNSLSGVMLILPFTRRLNSSIRAGRGTLLCSPSNSVNMRSLGAGPASGSAVKKTRRSRTRENGSPFRQSKNSSKPSSSRQRPRKSDPLGDLRAHAPSLM